MDQELTPALDEVGTDTPNTRQQDEQKITSAEQGQENQEDKIPPPLPQNTEDQEPVKKDHHYFEKLRNKRYEFGPDSLTEKEKEALAEDLRINADSRKKSWIKTRPLPRRLAVFSWVCYDKFQFKLLHPRELHFQYAFAGNLDVSPLFHTSRKSWTSRHRFQPCMSGNKLSLKCKKRVAMYFC